MQHFHCDYVFESRDDGQINHEAVEQQLREGTKARLLAGEGGKL